MAIDSVTAVQYTGYFYNPIRQTLEQGKLAPEVEEARIQRVLEEERKRVQPVVNVRRRVIEHYIIEKDIKRRCIEYDELAHVDIFA